VTPHNVLLPFALPDTAQLRKAVAHIIRDIQREYGETDQATADKLGVHANTIASARNERSDLGALTIARIGAAYGPDALSPYSALYGATAHGIAASDAAPLSILADTLAALHRATGPKQRLDALPIVKEAADALNAYALSLERFRIAA
jgi:hypothetical protein